MRFFVFLSFFAVMTLWNTAPLQAASDLETARQNLKQLQTRINQTLDNLSQSKQAASSLLKEMRSLNRQIRRERQKVDDLQTRIADLKQQIVRAEDDLRDVERKLRSSRRDVERRLVALYKEGEIGPLRILFSQTTPAEMAWQYEYLTRVVGHDRQLLATYRQQQQQRQAAIKHLEQSQSEREKALDERKARQALLSEARQVKQRILKRTERNQTLLASLLQKLEDQAGTLSSLVKKLESEKSATYTQKDGPFYAQRGRLMWPARGKVQIGFGRQRHPELGTVFQSRGLELSVKPKTPVASVWPGRVVFSDRFSGYGNLVIVDHGGGFHTLYARMDTPIKKKGELVEKGEMLARTDSGGQLYFEIRQKGAPSNPSKWLSR